MICTPAISGLWLKSYALLTSFSLSFSHCLSWYFIQLIIRYEGPRTSRLCRLSRDNWSRIMFTQAKGKNTWNGRLSLITLIGPRAIFSPLEIHAIHPWHLVPYRSSVLLIHAVLNRRYARFPRKKWKREAKKREKVWRRSGHDGEIRTETLFRSHACQTKPKADYSRPAVLFCFIRSICGSSRRVHAPASFSQSLLCCSCSRLVGNGVILGIVNKERAMCIFRVHSLHALHHDYTRTRWTNYSRL